jgi:hypothetical protein
MRRQTGSNGFTVLMVLVTLTVLMLMWSAVYQRARAAIETEHAGLDRSMYVDGPRLAAAQALDFVAGSRPPDKLLSYRVRVQTTDGPFTYLVTITSASSKRKGKAPSRYRIRVRPAPQMTGPVTGAPFEDPQKAPDGDGNDGVPVRDKGKGRRRRPRD